MMYHCMLMKSRSPYTPNFLKMAVTPCCTPKSTSHRKNPKNATVAMTTQVVEITSSFEGQVTFCISTRTSCRNSRVSVTVPETRVPTPAAVCASAFFCSSFFADFFGASSFFTACVAMNPLYFPGIRPLFRLPHPKHLAGEEGFEPPYPVLETGVLAVGRPP